MSRDEDRLFEELTISRRLEDPVMPPWCGILNEFRWCRDRPMALMHLYSASKRYKRVKYQDIHYCNNDGKLHRIFGPAYISKNYDLEIWYKEGIIHREDGPAITFRKNEYWVLNGEFHRIGGPAVTQTCGPKLYYINGQKYSPKQYKWEMDRRKRKGLINETEFTED